jgi:hypothetical protein
MDQPSFLRHLGAGPGAVQRAALVHQLTADGRAQHSLGGARGRPQRPHYAEHVRGLDQGSDTCGCGDDQAGDAALAGTALRANVACQPPRVPRSWHQAGTREGVGEAKLEEIQALRLAERTGLEPAPTPMKSISY